MHLSYQNYYLLKYDELKIYWYWYKKYWIQEKPRKTHSLKPSSCNSDCSAHDWVCLGSLCCCWWYVCWCCCCCCCFDSSCAFWSLIKAVIKKLKRMGYSRVFINKLVAANYLLKLAKWWSIQETLGNRAFNSIYMSSIVWWQYWKLAMVR